MEFQHRLKEARAAAGLSQRQLGIAMGLGGDTGGVRINRYEMGAGDPSVKAARLLASLLKVPLAYLFASTPELAAVILQHDAA